MDIGIEKFQICQISYVTLAYDNALVIQPFSRDETDDTDDTDDTGWNRLEHAGISCNRLELSGMTGIC